MDSIEIKSPAERYKAIADAIREKNGTTELMYPADMPQAILDIVSGTGIELGIAYGETPPEDTSKLWIKAKEPENITINSDIDGAGNVKLCDTHLPEPIFEPACSRVGNKIYLFSGYDGSGYTRTTKVFDVETQTASSIGSYGYFRNGMASAIVGTNIYICGGDGTYGKDVNIFDTQTETFTRLSSVLPNRCHSLSCVSVGTKVYMFGGHDGYNSKYLDTITVFDANDETVTVRKVSTATLPCGCNKMASAVVGTKIYLFGGYDGSVILDQVLVFDTANESLTKLSVSLPVANACMCGETIGTKIYLFGGLGEGCLDKITVFDTETETITTLNETLPIPLEQMRCASVGNKIYIFGGEGEGFVVSDTINIFTLTHPLSQGNIELQSSFLNNKFKLINTENAQVEIGVENVYVGNENNEAESVDAFLHNGTEWVQI